MLPFEFVVKGTPISLQAKRKRSIQNWKKKVRTAAVAQWPENEDPCTENVLVKITYFYDREGPDVDNISKPIVDSLKGLVYHDDRQVVNANAWKKDINGSFRIRGISVILAQSIAEGDDFVHVSIDEDRNPEVLA